MLIHPRHILMASRGDEKDFNIFRIFSYAQGREEKASETKIAFYKK